jgi:DnaJ-class molecular chaperone
MRPIVLDYYGQPRPPYSGPAVASVVTQTCWLCHGDGHLETGMHGGTNVGMSCRCSNCGGSGYVTQEAAQ